MDGSQARHQELGRPTRTPPRTSPPVAFFGRSERVRLFCTRSDRVLVLTRKPGEEILIGERITVTVCDIAGGKVRLGIDAPADVPIARREVADRIRQQGPRRARLAVFGDGEQRRDRRLTE